MSPADHGTGRVGRRGFPRRHRLTARAIPAPAITPTAPGPAQGRRASTVSTVSASAAVLSSR